MVGDHFDRPGPRLRLLVVGCALTASACMAEIGDSCATNIECSVSGDRICDKAQPDGYCTVEGCGPATCPDEAVCVGFFPAAFLSTACDPETEGAVDPSLQRTNDCAPEEICIRSGHCALFSLERRFCMKSCSDDGDCRDAYECRHAGTAGAEAVIDRREAGQQRPVVRFCAPRL